MGGRDVCYEFRVALYLYRQIDCQRGMRANVAKRKRGLARRELADEVKDETRHVSNLSGLDTSHRRACSSFPWENIRNTVPSGGRSLCAGSLNRLGVHMICDTQ